MTTAALQRGHYPPRYRVLLPGSHHQSLFSSVFSGMAACMGRLVTCCRRHQNFLCIQTKDMVRSLYDLKIALPFLTRAEGIPMTYLHGEVRRMSSLNPGKSNISLHGLQLVIRATATHKALYDLTIRVVRLISDYDLCTILRADYIISEELS